MSNELVRRICNALEPEAPAPRDNALVRTSERVHAPCFCGKYDKPFLDIFERQPSGLWRMAESLRVEGPLSGTRYQSLRAIEAGMIEGYSSACPWCGDKRGRFHCECGAVSCSAKLRRNVFVCRRCGDKWETDTLPDNAKIGVAVPSVERHDRYTRGATAPPRLLSS